MGSYPGKKCQSGIITVITDVFIVLHLLFCSRRAVCLNVSVAPERMWFYCECPSHFVPAPLQELALGTL